MTEIARKKPKTQKAEKIDFKEIEVTLPSGEKFPLKIHKKSRHKEMTLDSSPSTHVAWQEGHFVDETNQNVAKIAGLFGSLTDIEDV